MRIECSIGPKRRPGAVELLGDRVAAPWERVASSLESVANEAERRAG
jgi:hypothetical protein